MIDKYKCPECDGEMPNSKNINNKLLCSACSYSVEVISGVPVFFSSVDSEKPEENTTGLSERLFSTPQLYKIFAAAKTYLFPDNSVGISEYISNKDVIDIGCGPSLNMKHSEYNIDDARSFAGVDVSLRFVLNAKKENPADMFDFAVASIDKLPYPDKSFDTSIISFVIHHVPIDKMKVMEEVLRVTKSNIINL